MSHNLTGLNDQAAESMTLSRRIMLSLVVLHSSTQQNLLAPCRYFNICLVQSFSFLSYQPALLRHVEYRQSLGS